MTPLVQHYITESAHDGKPPHPRVICSHGAGAKIKSSDGVEYVVHPDGSLRRVASKPSGRWKKIFRRWKSKH